MKSLHCPANHEWAFEGWWTSHDLKLPIQDWATPQIMKSVLFLLKFKPAVSDNSKVRVICKRNLRAQSGWIIIIEEYLSWNFNLGARQLQWRIFVWTWRLLIAILRSVCKFCGVAFHTLGAFELLRWSLYSRNLWSVSRVNNKDGFSLDNILCKYQFKRF